MPLDVARSRSMPFDPYAARSRSIALDVDDPPAARSRSMPFDPYAARSRSIPLDADDTA
jgi:hypothetical protein